MKQEKNERRRKKSLKNKGEKIETTSSGKKGVWSKLETEMKEKQVNFMRIKSRIRCRNVNIIKSLS